MEDDKPQELWLAEYTLQWLVDLKIGKRILVAVDDSAISHQALQWVVNNVAKPHDQVQIVTVAPLVSGAGCYAAQDESGEHGFYDRWATTRVLERAIEPLRKSNAVQNSIQTHVLTAMGGTSGIGNVIVNFGRISKVDMIVVGSRGVNRGIKHSLMSIMGLGSVSKHCIHNSEIPVLVLHGKFQENQKIKGQINQKSSLRVCVAVDGGQKSYEALEWTCQNIIQRQNSQVMLHIVSVSLPVPKFEGDQKGALGDENCRRAREVAYMNGLGDKQITAQVLNLSDQNKGNQIGESICKYVNSNQLDMLVLGARNMSDLQRSVLKFVGLGSVSDYCVQNLMCPVLVYKSQQETINLQTELEQRT